MSVFKKNYLDMNHHQRHEHDLEEARVSLHKAGKQLEDHLFDVSQDRARIKMLRERIARLEDAYAALPAPAEQVSWLRKAVMHVRDAFAKPAPASLASFEQLPDGVTEHYCRHINESAWVHCTRQDYIELRVDPLYDTIAIPAGKYPPDIGIFQTLRYKPADEASKDGGWAVCSHTFWLLNYKSSGLEFSQ